MKIKLTNQTYAQSLSFMSHQPQRETRTCYSSFACALKEIPFHAMHHSYSAVIVLQRHRFCSLIASYMKISLWETQLNAIWPHQIRANGKNQAEKVVLTS